MRFGTHRAGGGWFDPLRGSSRLPIRTTETRGPPLRLWTARDRYEFSNFELIRKGPVSREDVNPVSVYVGNGWQDWMTMELWPLLLKFGCLLSDPARIYPGCTKPNVLQVYRISDKRKGTKKNANFGQLRTFLPFFEGAKMPWCSCRRRWAKNCLWFLKIFSQNQDLYQAGNAATPGDTDQWCEPWW